MVILDLLGESETNALVTEHNICAKVFASKAVNCKRLKGALLFAWGRNVSQVQVCELAFNLFQFRFKDAVAMEFILNERLWLFDKCLMLFRGCVAN